MMQKKVSVIIPFYRGIEWLFEAVESVLAQTYSNIEVIVVNDGSPEDVEPFLDKYKDRIVYRYQKNQGVSVARNLGMNIATGDYIAFEDSDDIWMPTKLEKQIAFMENNHCDWSHTGWYNWWPQSGKLQLVDNKNDYDEMGKQLLVSCHIATPSVVVSRKTLTEQPDFIFPVELRKGQDTAYYRMLAQYYKLALIQEPLVKVRMREDNSYKDILKRFELRANDYKKHKEAMPLLMRLNGRLYVLYNKMFGKQKGQLKIFIAKCCLVLPYAMERVYLKWLIWTTKKDERYILRWKE